ncbi:MAG: sulfatase-like hydrolase/transferase [Planctomycetes bacterium]|nr:sulfatase-like hydrolase/transferase [Planctomycetota bacterium]
MKLKKSHKVLVLIVLLVVIALVSNWLQLFDIPFLSEKKVKNVLLISMDTCRADFLSCYGYSRMTTPNIDEIAKKGILFENAISPVGLTLPSHATMLTGTIPPHHGIHDNPGYVLAESNVTLAEVLKENGFTTGAIVSAFVLNSKFGINQGFDTYIDDVEIIPGSPEVDRRDGKETTELANAWLEKHQKENFFLFLHYYDPHGVHEAPEPYNTFYPDNPYAGEIAYTDYCISKVIDKLKKLGLYDSTLIIITADHGEALGEHGELSHGYFVYQDTQHVPLIMKVPGGPKKIRVPEYVGIVDIPPTVCSILGLKMPANIEGRDLSHYFSEKKASPAKEYYCESLVATRYGCNPVLGIVSDGHKYIQTTRPELYDLKADPRELENLIDDQPQRARIMQDQLKHILEETVKVEGQSKVTLDAKSRERLEALGYVTSGSLDDSFEFDQTKKDPKDFIELHVKVNALALLYFQKETAELKKTCIEMLEIKSDLPSPYYYLGTLEYDNQNYQQAIGYFNKFIIHEPNSSKILNNLGLSYGHMGQHEKAMEYFDMALEANPDYVGAHYNKAMWFLQIGKFDEAISELEKAQQSMPLDEDIKNALKLAIDRKKQYNAAVKALEENADSAQANYDMAVVYQQQNKKDLAFNHYKKVLEAKPESIELRTSVAIAMFHLGRVESAIEEHYKILDTQPKAFVVLDSAAWILATTEDENSYNPTEALKLAEKACELTGYRVPEFLDTLAAAYAAVGNFDKAIETAQRAGEFANLSNKTNLSNSIYMRLELYKKGKAYRPSLDAD